MQLNEVVVKSKQEQARNLPVAFKWHSAALLLPAARLSHQRPPRCRLYLDLHSYILLKMVVATLADLNDDVVFIIFSWMSVSAILAMRQVRYNSLGPN